MVSSQVGTGGSEALAVALCPYCQLGELDAYGECGDCEERHERQMTAAYFAMLAAQHRTDGGTSAQPDATM
jgi:hypothetical protein